jgi:hypothetical protein
VEEHAGLKAVDALTAANQSMMGQFITLLSQIGQKKEGGTDTAAIIALITSMQAQQQTLMLKMIEMSGAQREPRGLTLDGVIGAVSKLAEAGLLNRGGDGAVPWYQSLLDKVTPELAQIAKALITLQATNRPPAPAAPASPAPSVAAASPAAPAAPSPTAASTPAKSTTIPVGSTTIPASADARPPIDVTAEHVPDKPAAPATPTEAEIERQHIISLGTYCLNALQQGTPGDVLAQSIETIFGLGVYAQIAMHGRDGMIARLKSIPEVWAPLALMETDLNKFVEEFINYGKQTETAAA